MASMDQETQDKRDRLLQYIYIAGEYDDYCDQLARLENAQYIPAAVESDGSKHTNGGSDRMANAVLRRIEYEESIQDDMEKLTAEMKIIEEAVSNLKDGRERRLMRLRYITGSEDGRKHMKWPDVAIKLFGQDDEAQVASVWRIHRSALKHISFPDSK